MNLRNVAGGSLQISLDVIAKIARLAALEVDGVADVSSGGSQTMRGLLSKTNFHKDVTVDMKDGVAAITVYVIPYYGCKVMSVCKKVQENVKQTIQIMTGITVTRVNVVAAGLAEAKVPNAE